MTSAGVQPPDAENRMSGGVEGSRGEIPVTPSDQSTVILTLVGVELARPVVVPKQGDGEKIGGWIHPTGILKELQSYS